MEDTRRGSSGRSLALTLGLSVLLGSETGTVEMWTLLEWGDISCSASQLSLDPKMLCGQNQVRELKFPPRVVWGSL